MAHAMGIARIDDVDAARFAMAIARVRRVPDAEIGVDVLPEWRDRFARIAWQRQVDVAKPDRGLQRDFEQDEGNGDYPQQFDALAADKLHPCGMHLPGPHQAWMKLHGQTFSDRRDGQFSRRERSVRDQARLPTPLDDL